MSESRTIRISQEHYDKLLSYTDRINQSLKPVVKAALPPRRVLEIVIDNFNAECVRIETAISKLEKGKK